MNDSKKRVVLRNTTEKISKTLVASHDGFKAHIDSIFKSLNQSSVYSTVGSLLAQNSVLKCFIDLFEIKHGIFYSCPSDL